MENNKQDNEPAVDASTAEMAPDIKKSVTIINEKYEGILKSEASVLDKAIELGGMLTHIKAKTKNGQHGKWTKFVNDNLNCSMDTVQNYMKLYKNKEMLEKAKTDGFRFLGIAKALKLIKEQKSESDKKSEDSTKPEKCDSKEDNKETDIDAERAGNLTTYFKNVSDYDSLMKDTCQFLEEIMALDINKELKKSIKQVLSNLQVCARKS